MGFRFNTRRSLGLPVGGGGAILKPQDVFATSLYTGNGGTQTITNGVDLAGKGGLVWAKRRDSAGNNFLHDTARGVGKYLLSNDTGAEASASFLTAFNVDGFTVGSSLTSTGASFASWSFARAAKFFDIVTWTGDGTSNRLIPHGLGIPPGMVVVKRLDTALDWPVSHRSLTAQQFLFLNSTASVNDGGGEYFNGSSAATITVGSTSRTNASGGRYVAYLFAHDPSADGIVQCGSYVGNADGTQPFVNLGWRPQFVILKRSSGAANWLILDAQRGWNSSAANFLQANTSGAETSLSGDYGGFASSGFQDGGAAGGLYGSNNTTTIYLAIRAPY